MAAQLGTTIVGRGDELAALRSELDAVRAARARVVLVEGPPGLGKTTPVEHLLSELADARVVRAGGDEFETGVELGVLAQLLRARGPLDAAGHVEAGARLLASLDDREGPAVRVAS